MHIYVSNLANSYRERNILNQIKVSKSLSRQQQRKTINQQYDDRSNVQLGCFPSTAKMYRYKYNS